jgi:hypothetical protein
VAAALGGGGAAPPAVVVVVVEPPPPPPPPPPPGLPGMGAAVGNRKLPGHVPRAALVTPFAAKLGYDDRPGAIWIVTSPPAARVIRPTWTAAVQTELLSEYVFAP